MGLFRNSILYDNRLHFVSKCSNENEDVDIYETNNIRKNSITKRQRKFTIERAGYI